MQSKIKTIIQSVWPLFILLFILNTPCASAADNNETLKGVVTLGAGGYGLKLSDGTLVRFMGSGGNQVFAACHNGDYCEISGLVLHSVNPPLFATISKVRRLKALPPIQTRATTSKTENTGPSGHDVEDTQNSSPFLLDDTVSEQKSTEPRPPANDSPKPPKAGTPAPGKNETPHPSTELPSPAEPDSGTTSGPASGDLHDKQNSNKPDSTTLEHTDATQQTKTTSPANSESGDTQNDSPFLLQDPPKDGQ